MASMRTSCSFSLPLGKRLIKALKAVGLFLNWSDWNCMTACLRVCQSFSLRSKRARVRTSFMVKAFSWIRALWAFSRVLGLGSFKSVR